MKYVRIRLFSSGELFSRLIQIRTWSKWNHVAFVVDDGLVLGALSQGVCITKPDSTADTRDFVINAPKFDWAWVYAQVGKPYDWTAIAGIALERDWTADDSWFCSELVATAFERSGTPLLRARQLNRVTPRDVSISPLLRPAS